MISQAIKEVMGLKQGLDLDMDTIAQVICECGTCCIQRSQVGKASEVWGAMAEI